VQNAGTAQSANKAQDRYVDLKESIGFLLGFELLTER
jgi:hypothetical protein